MCFLLGMSGHDSENTGPVVNVRTYVRVCRHAKCSVYYLRQILHKTGNVTTNISKGLKHQLRIISAMWID